MYKSYICFLILAISVLQGDTSEETKALPDFPVVHISHGRVKGKKVIRLNDPPYWTFLGIPYARPPIGDLRFKAPLDPEPWNGTRDALDEGKVCIQQEDSGDSFTGAEDCLFINVYTSALPGFYKSRTLKPVMVWIHGGAFMFGSGDKLFQGPEYLIDKGVVYVSLNYRLGVFGFLSTDDEAIPGNAGLKDQVLALRWVQGNIAKFGGDPRKITIFGESAGAGSVSYHMLSPMSKGLFHRAIAESGTAASPLSVAVKPRETALLVSRSLGFSGNSSQDMAHFLRKIPADELLNATLNTYSDRDKYRFYRMIYVPSLEPPVEGEERFLPDHPLRLLTEGRFHHVPFLTGVNSAEGIAGVIAGGILEDYTRIQEIDKDFGKFFKPELRVCKEDPCGDEILAKLKAFYFGNQSFSNEIIYNFIRFWTDLTFTEGTIYTVKKMASHSHAPLYLYEFTYDGNLAFLKNLLGAQIFKGVCHGDELGYIFNVTVLTAKTELDFKTRDAMVTMWTDFAKTGNPTPPSTGRTAIWQPYTKSSRNYLDIGSELVNKKNLHDSRVNLWHELYSKYEGVEYH